MCLLLLPPDNNSGNNNNDNNNNNHINSTHTANYRNCLLHHLHELHTLNDSRYCYCCCY